MCARVFLLIFVIFCPLEAFVKSLSPGLSAGILTDTTSRKSAFALSVENQFEFPVNASAEFQYSKGRYSLALLLSPRFFVYPFLGLQRDLKDKGIFIPLGLGVRLRVSDGFSLQAEARYNKAISSWRNNSAGALLGFSYDFPLSDEDRDGVKNASDRCPRTPRYIKVDMYGCPLDSDGDGVFDGIDRCPSTPFAAFVDSLGCPFDSDSDGVYDGVDICPGTPRTINVDSVGCPIDSDKDNVPDFEDSCANTPVGATVDKFGCPRDSDFDGVFDGIDRCPMTPTGIEVDKYGCPLFLPVTFEVVYDPLDEFGNLKPALLKSLDLLAKRIRAYPNRIIELGGYTDSEGSAPYNINRAKAMVNKIRDYIVSKGVLPETLKLAYYGEVNFIADNSTPQGRAKNRRVEFKFVGDTLNEKKTEGK
jgi:hypothetical protein